MQTVTISMEPINVHVRMVIKEMEHTAQVRLVLYDLTFTLLSSRPKIHEV